MKFTHSVERGRGPPGRSCSVGKTLRTVTIPMILAGVLGFGLSSPAHAVDTPAQTFYVSATGNDGADGLTASTAWATLAAANSRVFRAGDMLLLQGGSTFAGPLYLDSADKGLNVGSWGAGRATILGKGSHGIQAYNTAGLTVHDVNLVGDAASFAGKGGVSLYNDRSTRLAGVTIKNISVQGFRNGIEVGAAKPSAGFANVRITDVRASSNRDAGIITYGPAFNAASPTYAHTNVHVERATAERNLGNPNDMVRNTGNGIVLGSVNSGSIIGSRATGNGSLCKAPEGPVGIWAYDARSIRIAYNNSHNNRTGSKTDGDGFDLDQNVSASILERNASSGNDGAGYLVYTAQNNKAHRDNIVRYNTSTNDAIKNSWYGGITVAGPLANTKVYGNRVVTTGSASRAPAVAIKSGVTGVQVTGNTLSAASGYAVVNSPSLSRAAVSFTSNTWSTSVQKVRYGTLYGSVAAWTRATRQS